MTYTCIYAYVLLFFFNDTATTEIYTLSLHDALPICGPGRRPTGSSSHPPAGHGRPGTGLARRWMADRRRRSTSADRKSTRLNSSHANISYAVFCLKKKTSIVVISALEAAHSVR